MPSQSSNENSATGVREVKFDPRPSRTEERQPRIQGLPLLQLLVGDVWGAAPPEVFATRAGRGRRGHPWRRLHGPVDSLLSARSGAFVKGGGARGGDRRLRGFRTQRGLVLFGLSRQPWGAPAAFRKRGHAGALAGDAGRGRGSRQGSQDGGDRRPVLPRRTASRRPWPESATEYTRSVRVAVWARPGGRRQVARRG